MCHRSSHRFSLSLTFMNEHWKKKKKKETQHAFCLILWFLIWNNICWLNDCKNVNQRECVDCPLSLSLSHAFFPNLQMILIGRKSRIAFIICDQLSKVISGSKIPLIEVNISEYIFHFFFFFLLRFNLHNTLKRKSYTISNVQFSRRNAGKKQKTAKKKTVVIVIFRAICLCIAYLFFIHAAVVVVAFFLLFSPVRSRWIEKLNDTIAMNPAKLCQKENNEKKERKKNKI